MSVATVQGGGFAGPPVTVLWDATHAGDTSARDKGLLSTVNTAASTSSWFVSVARPCESHKSTTEGR